MHLASEQLGSKAEIYSKHSSLKFDSETSVLTIILCARGGSEQLVKLKLD